MQSQIEIFKIPFNGQRALLSFVIFLMSILSFIPLVAQEICDNGIDDDNDGLIDLNDTDCDCISLETASLFPNPSFEDMTCCPTANAMLNCAVGWIQASAPTTDYVHTCGILGNTNIPAFAPLPFPDGEGGVGFRDGEPFSPQWKEYVAGCLLAPLVDGTKYSFSFYVGFQNNVVGSQSIALGVFATQNCNSIPFGSGSTTIGCPQNDGWDLISEFTVNGNNEWVEVEVEFVPNANYNALALGPACKANPNINDSPYFYLDGLSILDESVYFDSLNTIIGSYCEGTLALEATLEAGSTIQWYHNGIALEGETEATLSLGQELDAIGIYEAVIFDTNGCHGTQSFELDYGSLDSTITESICEDQFYNFFGDDLNEPGIYTYTANALNGCDTIYTLALEVFDNQEKIVTAEICAGESYNFGGTPLNENGIYTLELIATNGCDSIITLDLMVHEHSSYKFQSEICKGEQYDFFGAFLDETGTYEVTIENNKGCDSLISLDLNVFSSGDGVELPPGIAIDLGNSIDIIPVYINPELDQFAWINEENVDLGNEEVLLDFMPLKDQWVYLTAYDSNGCQSADSIFIRILKNVHIYAPNIFSPNLDNINDHFKLFGNSSVLSIREIHIFDRWGERVYYMENIENNDGFVTWDGKFKSIDARIGVYTYMVTFELIDGSDYRIAGDLTLIR